MKRTFIIAAAALSLAAAAQAAPSAYPLLRVLSRDDALFVQQQAALDDFRLVAESHNRGETPFPPLTLFEYSKRQTEDLFSLNARLGLRYDTLATLNGTVAKAEFDARARILIPSQDGLFINNPPRGWLEELMLSSRLSDGRRPQAIVVTRDGKQQSLFYFPNDSFTGMERKYYLGMLLRFPLDVEHVSSTYGWRSDPFTGKREFHDGVDLAAPEGSAVRAARDGVVQETGSDATLGNYVILGHIGGMQTVYGHLSAIHVIMNQTVTAGAIIGAVGHTGYATGPHLHFEVREKGQTTDPVGLLAMKKG